MALRAPQLDRLYADITVGAPGRPLSPATIRRVHAVLRSAPSSAVERRLLPYNPADHIELAPEDARRAPPSTADESLRLPKSVREERLHLLNRPSIVAGPRRGEDLDPAVGGDRARRAGRHECRAGHHRRRPCRAPKTHRSVRVVTLDDVTTALRADHRAERLAWHLPDDPTGRL